MKNDQIIQRLDTINEEIAFLEEVSNQTSEIEERLENLRTLRYELERKLHYDKITKAPADQEGC